MWFIFCFTSSQQCLVSLSPPSFLPSISLRFFYAPLICFLFSKLYHATFSCFSLSSLSSSLPFICSVSSPSSSFKSTMQMLIDHVIQFSNVLQLIFSSGMFLLDSKSHCFCLYFSLWSWYNVLLMNFFLSVVAGYLLKVVSSNSWVHLIEVVSVLRGFSSSLGSSLLWV
jgi:hypothetical protein